MPATQSWVYSSSTTISWDYMTEAQANQAWYAWVAADGTTTGVYPQTAATNTTYLTATDAETIWLQWVVDMNTGAVTQIQSNDRATLREAALSRQREQQIKEQELLAGMADGDALYRLMQKDLRFSAAIAGHYWERIFALEAEQTAEALLLKHLTPEQRADYLQYGHFNVISMSRRRFRIRKFTIANVDEVDEQGVVRRLCCHPIGSLPGPDMMLAQKLHLEHNEDEFLRLANVHYRRS